MVLIISATVNIITSFECNGCSNMCEIVEIEYDGKILSRWGDKCGSGAR